MFRVFLPDKAAATVSHLTERKKAERAQRGPTALMCPAGPVLCDGPGRNREATR